MWLLRHLYEAIRRPWASQADHSLWRRFLLKPRVFDVISVLIQLKDARRIRAADLAQAETQSVVDQTVRHNLGLVQRKLITRSRRTEPFYQVAVTPWRDVSKEQVLVIGSRNVQELWTATLYGFTWDNITAIDLFSVNPKIQVMNMEEMTFPDRSFDMVMMINTLGYASDVVKAVRGVARVLKPGGRFVFNHVYDPGETKFGQAGQHRAQIVHAALIEAGFRIYFYEPVDKINSLGRPQTSHTLGVRKAAGAEAGFDVLRI